MATESPKPFWRRPSPSRRRRNCASASARDCLQKGFAAQAVRLLGARIGTVNSVCGGLVGEYALGARPFACRGSHQRRCAGQDFPEGRRRGHLPPCRPRLTISPADWAKSKGRNHYDWRNDVNDIVAGGARQRHGAGEIRRFRPALERKVLRGSSRRRSPGETADGFEQALNAAITALLDRFQSEEGLTRTTQAHWKRCARSRAQEARGLSLERLGAARQTRRRPRPTILFRTAAQGGQRFRPPSPARRRCRALHQT